MTSRHHKPGCPPQLLWKLAILLLAANQGQALRAADIVTAPFRLLHELGGALADPLSLPTDVAVDSNGNLYIVDSGNNRIVVVDSTGRQTGQFAGEGDGDGQLQDPVGIGVAPDDSIYVADRGNHRLVWFSSDGAASRSIPLQEGDEDVVPIDVAVSADGSELFVSANNSHRIVVYSREGTLLRGWGEEGNNPGQFRYPATLALAVSVLYFVDVLIARILTFDFDGHATSSFGKLGAGQGTLFRPKGVAVDAAGRVYVSDSYLGVIQVFSTDGDFLHVLGDDGVATQFENPVGLASSAGRIVLAQMLPNTVLIIEPGPGN